MIHAKITNIICLWFRQVIQEFDFFKQVMQEFDFFKQVIHEFDFFKVLIFFIN